jgi:hypothetical protein
MTKRGIIIGVLPDGGRVSLYGEGVHNFTLDLWQGLEGSLPACGEVAEVDLEDNKVLRVRHSWKTLADMLRSLTPEELAAIPRVDPAKVRSALQKGTQERQREQRSRGGGVVLPSRSPTEELWHRLRKLEKRVEELERNSK